MCSSWTALRPCTGVCAYRGLTRFLRSTGNHPRCHYNTPERCCACSKFPAIRFAHIGTMHSEPTASLWKIKMCRLVALLA